MTTLPKCTFGKHLYRGRDEDVCDIMRDGDARSVDVELRLGIRPASFVGHGDNGRALKMAIGDGGSNGVWRKRMESGK